MKNAIREYLEYTDEEKREIWNNCTFVFDTNVLLNLYRYSKKTQDALFNAINNIKDKIWMPYQVAKEFMNNRLSVIFEKINDYDKLKTDIDNFINNCKNVFKVDDEKELNEKKEYLCKWIESNKKKNLLLFTEKEDKILNKILKLFENKVGIEPDDNEKKEWHEIALKRFEKQIPPGFKDKTKETEYNENNCYGDYFVWKEILNYSKENETNIIFVTDDQKNDWWNIVKGKTIGPRIELRKEFYDNCDRKFHMYTMENFIKQSKQDVDKEVINEVRKFTYIDDARRVDDYNIRKQNMMILENQAERELALLKNKLALIDTQIFNFNRIYKDSHSAHSLMDRYNQYNQLVNERDTLKRNISIMESKLNDLNNNLDNFNYTYYYNKADDDVINEDEISKTIKKAFGKK